MPQENFHPDARRLITESCLIAADIDKTLLAQVTKEKQEFLTSLAPRLLEAAALGTNLAFLTGNSMNELTRRFLNWLLGHLYHADRLDLLDQFHFFCNSGGVYAHFSFDDERLCFLLSQRQVPDDERRKKIFDDLTTQMDDGKLAIHPRFIDPEYIQRTRIPKEELAILSRILEKHAGRYIRDLSSTISRYEKTYDISKVSENDRLVHPHVDLRKVCYGRDEPADEATVQITLKPILSFRHARDNRDQASLVGQDRRSELIKDIQSELDSCGLSQYVARPGGRSSIDVTLQKLDKAYALEFLIDHLNLQGQSRQGKQFGSNAIYLGDEVLVGGGNDYPVTRIPGLLVFAVNPKKELIPCLSGVFVPSPLFWGTDATAEVLTDYNRSARLLLAEFGRKARGVEARAQSRTALEALKKEIFGARIQKKIERLKHTETITAEDWQALHAFVTLMSRDDPAGRGWLSILIQMLDAAMVQIGVHEKATPYSIGSSYEDI